MAQITSRAQPSDRDVLTFAVKGDAPLDMRGQFESRQSHHGGTPLILVPPMIEGGAGKASGTATHGFREAAMEWRREIGRRLYACCKVKFPTDTDKRVSAATGIEYRTVEGWRDRHPSLLNLLIMLMAFPEFAKYIFESPEDTLHRRVKIDHETRDQLIEIHAQIGRLIDDN